VKIRPIRVIRVPRPDGDAISYAVAGIAEFCDSSHDPGENISSSRISRFFIIFNPEVLIRYCMYKKVYQDDKLKYKMQNW